MTSASSLLPAVEASSVDSFTDSLGINMNISAWDSMANINLGADENALAYLGFKMVRGGLYSINAPAYAQLNTDLGIKYDFVVSGQSTAAFNASLQVLEANPGMIDYIEGPNESDLPGGTTNYNGLTGLAATAAEMHALYAAVKSDPQTANISVIQASLGNPASYAAYGNQAGTADYTNSHIYYNFFPFGTDPLERNGAWMQSLLTDAEGATPGVPNIVTESGYETLAGTGNAVSLIDQAKYLLDDVFDLWNAGVAKTFIFMLVDTGPSSPNPNDPANNYGIYNADWTPKPAAIAIHNLMTLLADTGTGGVAPGSLSYSLTGEPASVQTTLLEKSDGTFVLAIWNEVQLQNAAGVDTAVAAVPVTLTLGSAFKSITIYDPLTGTSAVQSFSNASTVQLMVPDHPVLIEISNTLPAASVAAANVPVINAPSQVMVAPGGIVQVGGVGVGNDLLGQISVQVSDSYGKLQMQDANGQALAGSGTDSIAISGSAAIVNAELASLAYSAAGSGGGDVIAVQVTGASGGAQSAFITVDSIARPALTSSLGPLLSVPTAMTVGTGGSVAIPDVVLTDDYYASNPGNLTLTVSAASGALQMQANGAELAAAPSLTVTGSYAAIVADLASLTYAAANAAGTDTLSFQVADAGGYTTSASTSITLGPDLTVDVPGAMQLAEGASGSAGVQIDDAQAAGNADQLQVTVSDVTGTLSLLNGSGVPAAGAGGHSITLTGTQDQVNAELATLVETAPGAVSNDVITVTATNVAAATASGSFNVTVLPTLAITAPGSMTAGAGMVTPVTGVAVSDSYAAAAGLPVTVVVSDSSGKLSMTNMPNLVAGSGSTAITLTGSLAVVDAALANLTYTAPTGTGADSISIAASDTAGGSSTASVKMAFAAPSTLSSYFQLADSAGDPLGRQAFLSSGGMVLTTAATGLNGAVSEQVAADGTVTLGAEQWNTVNAATVTDSAGGSYVMDNFRSANAVLSAGPASAGQAQTLTVNTAQSGTITLGSGNQNVVINAGLGGATSSSNKTFSITEGSGTDALTVNGYAGFLPTSNVASITTALVTAGSGSEVMNFANAHASVIAGSGTLTVYGDNYGTNVTAGAGSADVWGGTGWNNFTYHFGDALMTIEDYNPEQDMLTLDKSLQAFMTQHVVSGGILLSFGNSPQSGILLKGVTAFSPASITWAGSVGSNIADSAGQYIGIAAPGSVAVNAGVVVPVSGVSIADNVAASNGLPVTVVVNDTYGKLAMTNMPNMVAGSGGNSITLTGSLAVVDAALATLTYSAPAGAATDSISVAASDTAGGSSSQFIAVPVSALGSLPAYFQLSDTAGDPLGRQAVVSSGGLTLTTAATGLNGAVSEQAANGIVTLAAEQWNTVYAATVTDSVGTSYVLDNFRSANANLKAGPNAAGQAQTLTINTAQNGTITLGTGNQNVIVNAGLGGATTSTNNTFVITEGSGTDTLTFNGYAGYLPTTNVANLTMASVTAGAGAEVMSFSNAHAVVKAGAGALTIYGSNYGTSVTAGTGTLDVWGGSGWNNFTYHSGDGMMTVEDFSAQSTLTLDQSLQAGMTEKTVTGGVELSFTSSPNSAILLKGQTSNVLSHITWH
jgi:hypothetical protein